MNIDINAILAAKLLGGGGGGGSYAQFGPGTELVGRKLEKTINLKSDTSYDSWTASTSAGQIKAASSNADFSIDTPDYDYAWTFATHMYVDVAFMDGATKKNTVARFCGLILNTSYPRFNSEATLASGYSAWTRASLISAYLIRYYSSSGTLTINETPYGPMFVNAVPTITGGTSTTYKLPKICAQCNTTYFTTARKAEVDSEHTDMTVTVDVYKTPIAGNFATSFLNIARTDLTAGL